MKYLIVAMALFVTACSTATDLPYAPTLQPISRGTPVIAAVSVSDARDETDKTYIGAIRSGLGIPMKTLTTSRPIAEEVRVAFEAALRARNLFGSPGQDTLAVTLTKLSANQLVRRDASAAFRLELRDASGQPVYSDAVDVNRVNGSLVTTDAGILASTGDLRAIMVQALTDAIDQALDKPAFVAVVQAR